MSCLVVHSHVSPLRQLQRTHCRPVIRINMAIVRDMTLGCVKAGGNATRMLGKTATKKECRPGRLGSRIFLPRMILSDGWSCAKILCVLSCSPTHDLLGAVGDGIMWDVEYPDQGSRVIVALKERTVKAAYNSLRWRSGQSFAIDVVSSILRELIAPGQLDLIQNGTPMHKLPGAKRVI